MVFSVVLTFMSVFFFPLFSFLDVQFSVYVLVHMLHVSVVDFLLYIYFLCTTIVPALTLFSFFSYDKGKMPIQLV